MYVQQRQQMAFFVCVVKLVMAYGFRRALMYSLMAPVQCVCTRFGGCSPFLRLWMRLMALHDVSLSSASSSALAIDV